MVIKETCSYPLQHWDEYLKHSSKRVSIPSFIAKVEGPYLSLGPQGVVKQITFYEFEEENYPEAHKYISRHFDELQHIPGFSYSITVMEENADP